MRARVVKVVLWRAKVENRSGALAQILAAVGGPRLEVVMGYVEHGGHDRAVIEVFPIVGRKQRAAAERVGLRPSATPTLLVTAEGRASVGPALAAALGAASISIAFLVALAAGPRSSALLGFASEADARSAARLIRKSPSPK
jgi:hypothetical protein